MDYALRVLLEGLITVAAPFEEQQEIIYNEESLIDEVFDFISIAGLDYLVETNQLSHQLATEIEELYISSDEVLKDYTWHEEDSLWRESPHVVTLWREDANRLLREVITYNKFARLTPSASDAAKLRQL
ncbi:MAG: hypothetical protein OIF51_15980 [Cellvibrionaceae bacterium]|nr:hypothetical protein [Cellvibrionaceae bacterium]